MSFFGYLKENVIVGQLERHHKLGLVVGFIAVLVTLQCLGTGSQVDNYSVRQLNPIVALAVAHEKKKIIVSPDESPNESTEISQGNSTENKKSNKGKLKFVTYRGTEKEEKFLELLFPNKFVNTASRVMLSEFSAKKQDGSHIVLFHPRLMLMLQNVADAFPGATFAVNSGYRTGKSNHTSPHNFGLAIDFHLEFDSKSGQADSKSGPKELKEKLFKFIRGDLKRDKHDKDDRCAGVGYPCGVGYYMNKNFVHLDVREKKTFWCCEGESKKMCPNQQKVPSECKDDLVHLDDN